MSTRESAKCQRSAVPHRNTGKTGEERHRAQAVCMTLRHRRQQGLPSRASEFSPAEGDKSTSGRDCTGAPSLIHPPPTKVVLSTWQPPSSPSSYSGGLLGARGEADCDQFLHHAPTPAWLLE